MSKVRTPGPETPAADEPVALVDRSDNLVTATPAEAEDSIEAGEASLANRTDLPSPDAPEAEQDQLVSVVYERLGQVRRVTVEEARRAIAAHEARLATPRDVRIGG